MVWVPSIDRSNYFEEDRLKCLNVIGEPQLPQKVFTEYFKFKEWLEVTNKLWYRKKAVLRKKTTSAGDFCMWNRCGSWTTGSSNLTKVVLHNTHSFRFRTLVHWQQFLSSDFIHC